MNERSRGPEAPGFAGSWDAGPHRVDWTGRTGSGARAASGVYFVRLQAGPSPEGITRKIALTR
jgi:hypothetical protein